MTSNKQASSKRAIVRTSPEDVAYLSKEQVMRTSRFQLEATGKEQSEHIALKLVPGLVAIFILGMIIVGNPHSDTPSFDTSWLHPYLVGAVIFFVTQCWAAFKIYTEHSEALRCHWFKRCDWSSRFGEVDDVELLVITGEDALELHHYYNNAYVSNLENDAYDPTVSTERTQVDDHLMSIESWRISGFLLPLGLWYRDRLVGMVSVQIQAPSVELSYSIAPTHQGRGYITRTVALLRDYAFEQLDAELVRIRCEHANTRSVNVAKRAGFHFAGHVTRTFHTGSRWLDVDHYHMHIDQWRASQRGEEEE